MNSGSLKRIIIGITENRKTPSPDGITPRKLYIAFHCHTDEWQEHDVAAVCEVPRFATFSPARLFFAATLLALQGFRRRSGAC